MININVAYIANSSGKPDLQPGIIHAFTDDGGGTTLAIIENLNDGSFGLANLWELRSLRGTSIDELKSNHQFQQEASRRLK